MKNIKVTPFCRSGGSERDRLQNENEVIMGLIRKAIDDNAHKAMDQEEHEHRCIGYCERYEEARQRLAEIEKLRLGRIAKKTKIAMFLQKLDCHGEMVKEFNEELWYSTVDFVTVHEDMRMVFTFRDGETAEISADMWKVA